MNKRGNAKTLVATHPGNCNAAKAGVFSPRLLAPRVAEIDNAIGEHPADDVARDVLRRELAALCALAEAMDRSLEEGGLKGRRDQPRSLINLRLRVNDKIRQTLEQYRPFAQLEDSGGDVEEEAFPQSLAQTIATFHRQNSIDDIAPREVDPEMFLRAVILAPDPALTTRDRLRARQMLTRRSKNRPRWCVCVATLKARDVVELREWIDAVRDAGIHQAEGDEILAALVRRVVAGEDLQPLFRYRLLKAAVEYVVRARADCSGAETSPPDGADATRVIDPAINCFWQMLLAADDSFRAKERLDAFAALDELGALPPCTCKPIRDLHLREVERDATRAYIVKVVAQKHYRAALQIARFPETYVAVRDAIDASLLDRAEAVSASDDHAAA